jgi:hypothetical protein
MVPGLGPLGFYRFYLGYYGNGALRIGLLGLAFLLLSLSESNLPFASPGFAIAIGLTLWWLVDLVRVLTNDLKPKNGEYE